MSIVATRRDFASGEQWQYTTLGQVAQVKGGKRLPKGEKFADAVTSFPYLRVTDFANFSIDTSDLRYLTPGIRATIARYTIGKNDVYISIAGSIGVTGMIPARLDGANLTENAAKLVLNENVIDPCFLMYFLASEAAQTEIRGQTVKNAQPKLALARIASLGIPLPPLFEQRKIAAVLGLVQKAIEQQERLIALTTELKKALLHKLFTEGLRGEPQKQTEIGPIPESWEVTSLGACCDIVSGSLSYTDFSKMAASDAVGAVDCMAVKVSDMNLPGNESRFVTANLTKRLSSDFVRRKLVPANTVISPKRGAAIATNKKRLTTTWTVLDPNLIGLSAKPSLDPEFLFHWWQTFDLRKITDPGPTPQLNKKDLVPILIPLPADVEEQQEIAVAISVVDSKMSCHRQKHVALTELFHAMLQQLMTAQLRVHDLDLEGLDCSMSG
jgi:type I restriction enzyme S subunit